MEGRVARFKLAPMSRLIAWTTAVCLLLPGVMLLAALRTPVLPARALLCGTAGFVVLLYVMVWLFFRPTRFEVGDGELRIFWPLRAQRLPLAEVTGAELTDAARLRDEFGRGARFGAGGLWGGFGWLLTPKGKLSMYVSRTESMVLVRFRARRPLLITPERPERFLTALSVARQ
jgi:hypothetical protein